MVKPCIRPARPADAPAVIAAVDAVCAERVYLLTEQYSSTPQWEAILHQSEEAQQCQKTPPGLLLLPLVGDQIIGWCRVFPGTAPKTRHAADIGIGLLPPYREQGIGTRLLERAIDWAKAQGFAKLTADCFSTNLRARALFRKLDFIETGVRYRQFKIDDDYVDEILLERFLP